LLDGVTMNFRVNPTNFGMETSMPLMIDSPAAAKSRREDARAALGRGVEHRGDNVVAPPGQARAFRFPGLCPGSTER